MRFSATTVLSATALLSGSVYAADADPLKEAIVEPVADAASSVSSAVSSATKITLPTFTVCPIPNTAIIISTTRLPH